MKYLANFRRFRPPIAILPAIMACMISGLFMPGALLLPSANAADEGERSASGTDPESSPSESTIPAGRDGDESTTGDADRARPYSDEVLAKAVGILREAGLRVSGRNFIVEKAATLSRQIGQLPRKNREVQMAQQAWRQASANEDAIRNQIAALNVQYGELNLKMAAAGNLNSRSHNQLAAMINATVSKIKQAGRSRDAAIEATKQLAAKLREIESNYAEVALAARADLEAIKAEMSETLQEREIQIAISVVHRNLQTPKDATADAILRPLDSRLKKIESKIFSESIPLDNENGSLFVDVIIGGKSTRMIVDSGATIISLPARTAAILGLTVPADAPEMRMEMADGRVIAARSVILPRVRVGAFEAENVRASVMDASADRAAPLLGMSFLGQFKFEIDAANNTLTMLKIESE
ncbi:MAG: retropepsin-like aspartic protease [Planctomycetota bacterium]